jgi:hypothetical protein
MVFLIELLPNINSCVVTTESASRLHPHVRDNQITLLGAGNEVSVTLPQEFALRPETLVSRISGNLITSRVACDFKEKPVIFSPSEDEAAAEILRLEACRPFGLSCKFCLRTLRPIDTPTRRILELPTENWQEMAASLCCHNELNELANQEIRPLDGDLLVSRSTIMTNPIGMITEAVLFVQPANSVCRWSDFHFNSQEYSAVTEVCCARCRSSLGHVHVKRLFSHLDSLNTLQKLRSPRINSSSIQSMCSRRRVRVCSR